jgi:hypothetical protein
VTGTPAQPVFSVLVDQNAPPAGLIPIATRNLPVGAIWIFGASRRHHDSSYKKTSRDREDPI